MLSLSTVGIPACKAGNQRLHGIGAANFGNRGPHQKFAPSVFFQQAQRTHHFATFRQFFDADCGSADAANDTDKRVIVQLERDLAWSEVPSRE